MKRLLRLAAVALAFAACMAWASPSIGQEQQTQPTASPNKPTSGELIENPKLWDGKTIDFTGEALTQAMVRGDYAWIHLNDDAYYLKNVEEGAALGGYNSGHAVWLPAGLVTKIAYYGDYTHEGDVVKIRGTFNAACAEHGGDMDIHATSLEVVTPGRVVREPVKFVKLGIALALLALAATLWVAYRRIEHLEMFGPMSAKSK